MKSENISDGMDEIKIESTPMGFLITTSNNVKVWQEYFTEWDEVVKFTQLNPLTKK